MSMRKTGNWTGVSRLMGTLPQTLEEAKQLSLRRWSLKAEQLAKSHMSAQDLGWTPLKSKTVAARLKKGQSQFLEDDLILIATSSYFQSITSWATNNVALVGVKKGTIGKDGQVIDVVARVHEFGSETKNIPARPLWQPTLDETMRWHYRNNRPEYLFKLAAKKQL